MWTAIRLAQEVGARLGRREVLLGCLSLAGLAGSVAAGRPAPPPALTPGAIARTPAAAAAELLDADRAFSAASARTTMIEGLSAMMDAAVIVPVPGRGFVDGLDAFRAELARDSLAATSHARWTPVRAGVSADGRHGFTFGFLEVRRADGTLVPGKYLAYWVKGARGWRVAAYRRVRRAAGAVDTALLAPALPPRLVAPATDPAVLAQHRESVMQAERDFAAESQVIGLRAGFAKFGSADAMNMGGPAAPGFTLGNEAIAAAVSQGVPDGQSPVNWGPERALVASSGDLGITFGFIVPNAEPPAGQQRPRLPFFTIWRRAGTGAPWRYVAE